MIKGFFDELIEKIYARCGMLHQETKMKELEGDRDRLAAKLELSNLYLTNILYTSDQAIMMVDDNEIFISWNKGAEKIFGFSESEVIGKPSSLLLPEGKRFVDELKRIQNDVKRNGQSLILETERKTKSGVLISVSLGV